MTKLEKAEKIVKQNGDCSGVRCGFGKSNECPGRHLVGHNNAEDKKEFFQKYIKEHKGEKIMNDIETKIDEIVKKAHLEIDKLLNEHKKSEFENIDDYYTTQGHDVYLLEDCVKNYKKFAILNNHVFDTREEAKRYADIDTKVREYIYRETLKNPLDWNNSGQKKYYIFYNYERKIIDFGISLYYSYKNILFCANRNMPDDLINLVGKDDLEWYVKRLAISDIKFDLDNLI